MTTTGVQDQIDGENAFFWDELCGSKFALELGITDRSADSLGRFDEAYFRFYPYLLSYLPESVARGSVLEIGLGYGSLSQALASRSPSYFGLDIAPGPVAIVRERLERLGIVDADRRVVQGSALEIPHPDAAFDCVVSIGCLHHTGDLPGAVGEVRRVLKPGGTAVVMLYNRYSLRRAILTVAHARAMFSRKTTVEREVRRVYDRTLAGEPAPVVEFVGMRQARRLFSDFTSLSVRRENFDDLKLLSRSRFLGAPARLLGVDLYVTVVR
ncbi:MAG: class I SAM-dependent methyltransferase [Actinobacteria bacterium]|nr:class I SAM-dependent methyltransferase [Actinomycetota bacterium]